MSSQELKTFTVLNNCQTNSQVKLHVFYNPPYIHSNLPLRAGDALQDPQWRPKAAGSTDAHPGGGSGRHPGPLPSLFVPHSWVIPDGTGQSCTCVHLSLYIDIYHVFPRYMRLWLRLTYILGNFKDRRFVLTREMHFFILRILSAIRAGGEAVKAIAIETYIELKYFFWQQLNFKIINNNLRKCHIY